MNPDGELVSLIDTALGLPISESTLADLGAYKEQIQSGSIEDDDRKYVVALCNGCFPRKRKTLLTPSSKKRSTPLTQNPPAI